MEKVTPKNHKTTKIQAIPSQAKNENKKLLLDSIVIQSIKKKEPQKKKEKVIWIRFPTKKTPKHLFHIAFKNNLLIIFSYLEFFNKKP
jgi:hypothetical protein